MVHGPRAALRELTHAVDLCLPGGTLNPDAVGYTRHPLHRTQLEGWGRNKRWEYWGIVTPSHVVGLTISSLDYVAVHQVFLLDRVTGKAREHAAMAPLGRGAHLPDEGPPVHARGRAGNLELEFTDGTRGQAHGTHLQATAPGVVVDLFAPSEGESLGVVVPWSPTRFQYTVKDVARPVGGTLAVDGQSFVVREQESWAVLDRGRGRWPYRMTWNWGAGSGTVEGHRVGLNLGGKWTTGTGSTECALVVDGRLHYLPEEPAWDYDGSDGWKPWHVHGPRVDATLTPFHVRVARSNVLLIASETHQAFGTWRGHALDDDGRRVSLDGLVGWAEEARNRW